MHNWKWREMLLRRKGMTPGRAQLPRSGGSSAGTKTCAGLADHFASAAFTCIVGCGIP